MKKIEIICEICGESIINQQLYYKMEEPKVNKILDREVCGTCYNKAFQILAVTINENKKNSLNNKSS